METQVDEENQLIMMVQKRSVAFNHLSPRLLRIAAVDDEDDVLNLPAVVPAPSVSPSEHDGIE
jgi:hypothetical protein